MNSSYILGLLAADNIITVYRLLPDDKIVEIGEYNSLDINTINSIHNLELKRVISTGDRELDVLI